MSAAQINLAEGAFGVVTGSVIMKKVNSNNEPLVNLCINTSMPQPWYKTVRENSRRNRVPINAKLVSTLPQRSKTISPAAPMKNSKITCDPHCPGETQPSPVSSMVATMPKFAGLNTCFCW